MFGKLKTLKIKVTNPELENLCHQLHWNSHKGTDSDDHDAQQYWEYSWKCQWNAQLISFEQLFSTIRM